MIAASAHLHTRRFVSVLDALDRGDLVAARTAWQPLVPLVEALFAQPKPGPLKTLLAKQGLMTPELRPPMTGASLALHERLEAIDSALGAVQTTNAISSATSPAHSGRA